MLEILKSRIEQYATDQEKYHYLREYFQLLILKIFDEQGIYKDIAFMGGTALRIVFDLPRFSEDLDFTTLENSNFNIQDLASMLKNELSGLGLNIDISTKSHKAVAVANIKISEVLYELGISPMPSQKILIKFEADQNPPIGFTTETTLINKEFLFSTRHLDLSSLFAGKLMAFFCRKYTKGRDYYDLMWFLTKHTNPNMKYLNTGLEQAQQEPLKNIDELKLKLIHQIKRTDFNHVLQDVSTFLENQKEARFFTNEIFESMVKNWQ